MCMIIGSINQNSQGCKPSWLYDELSQLSNPAFANPDSSEPSVQQPTAIILRL